jgi:hypothetical protein
MAPLTWRDVAAPNFSGVADSQRLTAQLLQNSFGGLQDALTNFQKQKQDLASSSYLAQISKYNDPAALDAAMKSGEISTAGVSADALKIGLGRDSSLLANQNQQLTNDRTQFGNTTAVRDDQLAQARLAAQPAAAKLLADVQNLAGSGDPAKVEQARQMVINGNQTLLDAGWKSDAIPGLVDSVRTTGTAGFGYKKDLLANDQYWEDQGVVKAAKDLAFKQIRNGVTPELGIRAIQDDKTITDPRIKLQAIDVIRKSAEAYSTPDAGTQLLNSLNVQTDVPQTSGQGNGADPLRGLIRKTEGAGDPSTLYGHAQKEGGAFAGVDVSKETIGNLKQFASSDGAYGRYMKNKLGYLATPMGEFQIVGDTLKDTAKEMGLSDDTVFTPDVQVAMFQHIADKALSGPKSMAGKMAALRGKWDGFKNVKDDVLASAITAYENGDRGQLGSITNGQSTPNAQAPNNVINAGAFPRGGQDVINQLLSGQPLSGSTGGSLDIARGGSINAGAFPPGNSLAELSRPQITLPVGGSPANVPAQAPAPTPAEQLAAAAAPAPAAAEGGWFSGLFGPSAANATPEAQAARAQAAALDPAAQLAQAAAPTSAPAGNTDSPGTAAQKLLDQGTIDQAYNADAPLIAQIQDAQSSTDSIGQVVKKLVAPGGALEGMNEQNVLESLNQTMQASGNKLKPAAAGALIAQNQVSKDLQSLPSKIPVVGGLFHWLDGDRFGSPEDGGTSARRINMDGVKKDLGKIGFNVDGSVQLGRGAAAIANQRQATVTAQQVTAIQAAVLQNSVQIAQIQQAIQSGNTDPQLVATLTRLQAQQAQFARLLRSAGQEPGSPTTIFSGQGEAPRPQ